MSNTTNPETTGREWIVAEGDSEDFFKRLEILANYHGVTPEWEWVGEGEIGIFVNNYGVATVCNGWYELDRIGVWDESGALY